MERYCQWAWKGLLARYEMLGLGMRDFEDAGIRTYLFILQRLAK